MSEMTIRKEVAEIVGALPRILATIAQGKLYSNWGKVFAWEETDKALDTVTKWAKDLPWTELTTDELDALCFGRWSDATELRLIPVHLYWAIPEETVVTCFDGVTTKKLKDADTDNRGGWLAYGFMPSPSGLPTPRVEDGRLVRDLPQQKGKP